MKSNSMKTIGLGINIAVDHIGSQDVTGVRIRVPKEIGQGDSRKRIIVGKHVLEKLHGDKNGFINTSTSSNVEIEAFAIGLVTLRDAVEMGEMGVGI